MAKHLNERMRPVVVKMPPWLVEAVKKKAGEKGLSAHVRELVIRDVAAGRRRPRKEVAA
jgi:predicted DNA binding CopG/RHH family protein